MKSVEILRIGSLVILIALGAIVQSGKPSQAAGNEVWLGGTEECYSAGD
ncbi:hypothetical protein [Pseudophaeobacter sp.]